MLPAYISYLLGTNSRSQNGTPSMISGNKSIMRGNSVILAVKRVGRPACMGLLATLGFIILFGLIGLVISSLGVGITRPLPWFAVFTGLVILGIGIGKIMGMRIHIKIPQIVNNISANRTKKNNKTFYQKFFLFGIGYGLASLSCTLPIFLLVVFQGLSLGGILATTVFLAYASGMGAVMISVSIAIGISNETFIKWLRKIAPKMNIITSIVLIMAGSYLIYYNLIVGGLIDI